MTKRDELESVIKKNCGYKIFPGQGFFHEHVSFALEELGMEPLVSKTLIELMKDCLQPGGKRRDAMYDELAAIHGVPFTLKYGKRQLYKAIQYGR
jgi:hypothetical protein